MAAALNRVKQSVGHLTHTAGQLTRKMAKTSNIVLYTDATPNGLKASMALEELGIVRDTSRIQRT